MMDVLTPKAIRRSTRLRVEIPVSVLSLDRQRPFAESCLVLVISAQGCGLRSARALRVETPVMINDLPGGSSVTGRVANCLPLGNDGQYFLIGVSLYTHGNVWGIDDPPADWEIAAKNDPAPRARDFDTRLSDSMPSASQASEPRPSEAKPAAKLDPMHDTGSRRLSVQKPAWPYNLFPQGAESPRKK